MFYQGWNDYELIYLINEGSELALNLMYLKYENMIIFKAHSCGAREIDIEDYLQEGLLLLTEALKEYRISLGKTFYKYFELILLRAFWRLRRKECNYCKSYNILEAKAPKTLSDRVKEYEPLFTGERLYIYREVFLYNSKTEAIALKLGVKKGKIYYEVKKIKEILRQEFDLLAKKR